MPQMSPMPWIILLIFTLASLMILSSHTYFLLFFSSKITLKVKPATPINLPLLW